MKPVLETAREASPSPREQPKSSLSPATLSMADTHSITERDNTSAAFQAAAGHSIGHTETHRPVLTPHHAMTTDSFNIEVDLAATLDEMSHEDLHSFAELQEDTASDEQIELYIYTRFLIFTKTWSIEHLDQSIQRTEGWLAITPTDHLDRIRRSHVLDMLVARKHQHKLLLEDLMPI
ncbi:hypothetical protein F4678DRAFT_413424 [Xylaria arbuscula]|nr:hypothetical protein F4678DRAFT_413424 [Xylaria arbuscula]